MVSRKRIIGVDESGKGDFFGPLVVASFLADERQVPDLKQLGVRDSKKIANKKLLQIDAELRRAYPHAVITILPEEYNRRYSEIRNLNKLLAWGHARAIEAVLDKAPAELAVSDKFGKSELLESALRKCGQTISLQQIFRGESVPQVAAASILARAAFLREMNALTEHYEVDLPRGAGAPVDAAGRKAVATRGIAILSKIAKIHFKNYHRVVNPTLFA